MKTEKQKRIKTILIKSLTVLVTLAGIAILLYTLFNTYIGETGLKKDFLKWTEENLWLAYFLFLFLTPLINIIPGISSIFFISLANLLFNNNTVEGMFRAFFAALGSTLLSTAFLFLLGKWGGKRVVKWIIGEKDYEKGTKILTYGGKACLPFVYLLPFFPDDTISFLCGMTNMSFSYIMINALIFRGIGVFLLCFFGTNLIDYSSFSWWQWLVAIIGGIIILAVVLYLVVLYYRYLRRKEEGRKYLLTMGLNTKKKERRNASLRS